MLYIARYWRWLTLFGIASLLTGCLALPQTGLFAFRLAVTSLGIEDVRIGPYSINAGLDTSGLTSLTAWGRAAFPYRPPSRWDLAFLLAC